MSLGMKTLIREHDSSCSIDRDIWLTGHRAAVIDKVQHFTLTFSISHHLVPASVNLPLHHKV